MIRENQVLLNRINIAIDGAIVFFSFLLGYWIRFHLLKGGSADLQTYVYIALSLIPLHLVTYYLTGLYESLRKKKYYRELGLILWANAVDFVLLQMLLFLFKAVNISRLALGIFFVTECTLLGVKHFLVRKFLHRLRGLGYNQKNVIIVGSGELAHRCISELRHSLELGYKIIGYIASDGKWKGAHYLGDFTQLDLLIESLRPDEVLAGLDIDEYTQMPQIIQSCEKSGTKLSMVPFYASFLPANPHFDSLNGLPLINLRRIPLDNIGNAFLKRTEDVIGSLLLILLTSPLMLAAAIGVKLSSPGPVIFRQTRVGLNKKEFCMYKFRSMRQNDRENSGWSRNSDPRKTRFGAFIRKFSIDELPQLFNVLRGDMSLVGPRPELPHFVEQFKNEVPLYMVKHQVRPGITGWAQVHGYRGDTSIKKRIECDIFYIENWSLLLDVKILFMTLLKVKNNEKIN